MARLPGLGFARTALALIVLLILVGVGLQLNGQPMPPGGSVSSPSWPAGPGNTATPRAPASVDSTPAGTAALPSDRPASEPIAYTNPDGLSPDDYAFDAYPFIEQARTLSTFAGIWGDQNQRDFHIALTGDIEGAIGVLAAGIPRGMTVYFHLAEHTYDTLDSLRDAIFDDRQWLIGKGIVLTWGSVGEITGRVSIGMSPLTAEAIAFMQGRYPGPVDYEDGGGAMLRPYTPLEVGSISLNAHRADEDLGLLTCGRRPFPATALESAGGAESQTGPEYDALRESLEIYDTLYPALSSLTWTEAEKDGFGGTFLARRGDAWLEAPVYAGVEGWVPGTINSCSLRPFVSAEGGTASWSLDPGYPEPSQTTTELHVLIVERACAGGSSPTGRIDPPIVSYDTREVRLTISVRSMGTATCPSNPVQAVTVVLPEPLGDRSLVGGVPSGQL